MDGGVDDKYNFLRDLPYKSFYSCNQYRDSNHWVLCIKFTEKAEAYPSQYPYGVLQGSTLKVGN